MSPALMVLRNILKCFGERKGLVGFVTEGMFDKVWEELGQPRPVLWPEHYCKRPHLFVEGVPFFIYGRDLSQNVTLPFVRYKYEG